MQRPADRGVLGGHGAVLLCCGRERKLAGAAAREQKTSNQTRGSGAGGRKAQQYPHIDASHMFSPSCHRLTAPLRTSTALVTGGTVNETGKAFLTKRSVSGRGTGQPPNNKQTKPGTEEVCVLSKNQAEWRDSGWWSG